MHPGRRIKILVILAFACALVATPALPQSAGDGTGKIVITDQNRDQVRLTPEQRTTVESVIQMPETVRSVRLAKEGSGDQGGAAFVRLPLPDGKQITLARTQPTVKTERGYTWRGQVESSGEPATLLLWNDGHLSGHFGYQGRVFIISHTGGGVHTMSALDPGKLPPDHGPETNVIPQPIPEPTVAPFAESDRLALEANSIVIDVMMLYTKTAASFHIGDAADLLEMAIERSNETFRNSGITNVRLRLVHTEQVDYEEQDADHFVHLFRMVDGEGPFKGVRKLRNEKRADIVGLVLHSPTGCGLSTRVGAEAEEAYFIVHHACAAITHSIAHEVGHIFGARHDRAIDSSNDPFPYAHGYINGTKWRDIMSYRAGCGDCPRIPFWSNPRVMYQGEPTGTHANDNARVILENAERVSKFR